MNEVIELGWSARLGGVDLAVKAAQERRTPYGFCCG
jgi:hypothetical protein